jgi:hypothetical protein
LSEIKTLSRSDTQVHILSKNCFSFISTCQLLLVIRQVKHRLMLTDLIDEDG